MQNYFQQMSEESQLSLQKCMLITGDQNVQPSGYIIRENLQIFEQDDLIQQLQLQENSELPVNQARYNGIDQTQRSLSLYSLQKNGNIYDDIFPPSIDYSQPIDHRDDQSKLEPQPIQKQIKKEYKRNPNKKNNQPKFIMRIFCQNIQRQEATYTGYEDLFQKVKQRSGQLYEWMLENKRHHVSLKHLQSFFGNKTDSVEESFLNRRALHKILKNALKKEVIQNCQLKKKLHYLQAAKVYLLRCSSQSLSCRIQCQ